MEIKRIPILVAATGLVVTGAGSLMTSRGLPVIGRPVWAAGGIVTLCGLLAFLVFQRQKARIERLRGSLIPLTLVIRAARVAAVSLATIGILSIGYALLQLLSMGWGGIPGLALMMLSTALSTFAFGIGLWLIAEIAVRVDRLSREPPPKRYPQAETATESEQREQPGS